MKYCNLEFSEPTSDLSLISSNGNSVYLIIFDDEVNFQAYFIFNPVIKYL